MPRSLPISILILFAVFLCSCTQKVYTHQQVMQNMHTKDDVLKQLGKPDLVKEGEGIEEWTYDFDNPNQHKRGKSDTIVATNAVSDTVKAYQPIKYNKYVRFIFDAGGNVAGYKSQGVDVGYVKKESFGTGMLKVVGIAAIIAIIVGLDVYGNSDINF